MYRSEWRRRTVIGMPLAMAMGLKYRAVAAQAAVSLPPAPRWIATRTLQVGPDRDIRTLNEAAKAARDGDSIVVDPGDYRADVAVWNQNSLTIRAADGRATLSADGASAAGKGIFVIRGRDVRIEGLRFTGARVPDRNGAGIRMEGPAQLTVQRCQFDDNENGILTANDPAGELHIVDSIFADNGAGDGQSHNVYVGAIDRLTVSGSYFARARVGHLLKSRARESTVAYSRLSSEEGTASYELEFPAGGLATVIGCLIQQGRQSENATIVSYGAEGYRWPTNELKISFCTLVNDRPGDAIFVRASKGNATVEMAHNLLVGRARMDMQVPARTSNVEADRSDFGDAARFDFRLRRKARAVGAAGMFGMLAAETILPEREYVHPAGSAILEIPSSLTPVSPGAFQRLAP